jgi:hypothetical protein
MPVFAPDPGPMLELLRGPHAAPRNAELGSGGQWSAEDAALGDRLRAVADGREGGLGVLEAARIRVGMPERRNGHHIVGVNGWGEALACARAAIDGRSVCAVPTASDDRLLALARTAQILFVVAPEITQGEVVALIDAVARAGRERPDGPCALGFHRAGSLPVLTLLDAKQRLSGAVAGRPKRDVLIDATASPSTRSEAAENALAVETDELVILDYRESTAKRSSLSDRSDCSP